MKLIDTHVHLYLTDFADDIDEVLERAAKTGVEKFFFPSIDSSETRAMLQLEQRYPGQCFAMAGLHPCSVKNIYNNELHEVEQILFGRTIDVFIEKVLLFIWIIT